VPGHITFVSRSCSHCGMRGISYARPGKQVPVFHINGRTANTAIQRAVPPPPPQVVVSLCANWLLCFASQITLYDAFCMVHSLMIYTIVLDVDDVRLLVTWWTLSTAEGMLLYATFRELVLLLSSGDWLIFSVFPSTLASLTCLYLLICGNTRYPPCGYRRIIVPT
jgi:hypothetical protein